jgi:hypothetical protein
MNNNSVYLIYFKTRVEDQNHFGWSLSCQNSDFNITKSYSVNVTGVGIGQGQQQQEQPTSTSEEGEGEGEGEGEIMTTESSEVASNDDGNTPFTLPLPLRILT